VIDGRGAGEGHDVDGIRFDQGAQLREIDVGGRPFSLAEAAGSIWIANFLSGTVERLDPATNRVIARIQVGGEPYGLAVGGGSVWVGRVNSSLVERIDPSSGRPIARLAAHVGVALAVAGGRLWTITSDGALRELAAA
jgi:YVTN family beta-propeller protein